MAPLGHDNVADEFTDPVHARPGLYPGLGRRVHDALASVLPSRATAPLIAASFVVPEDPLAPHAGDQTFGNVYPLW